MGELITALQRLQEIELELNHLRRQEERKKRQVNIAERQIRQIDEEVAELQAECARQQREVDQLDHDVNTRKMSIAKHREELLRVRTNKDYAAILTAINTEEADKAKIEKLGLEKLAALEAIQEKVKERTDEQATIRTRMEAASRALEEHRAENAEQRTALEQQRDAAAEALPISAVATFSRVAQRHDGEALAEIIRQHPKRHEYACSGCNMQIPLDAVNTVRSQDEIKMCPSCGRILCAPENSATGT
jgi:predicted  nucleic acid-binding Zn-ribbon protein